VRVWVLGVKQLMIELIFKLLSMIVSRVYTDGWLGYNSLTNYRIIKIKIKIKIKKDFDHHVVIHENGFGIKIHEFFNGK